MSHRPLCSIIIPSYCSAGTIGACLAALLGQDATQPYEIIVVDSSPDATVNFIRRYFPQVRLIHLAQQTDPALARNLGARQAHGEILAFIDADCVARPDWLRRLCLSLQQGYDGVGGAIANGNGESLVSWAGYFCEFREFLPGGSARMVNNLTLGNVAYRSASFWAVGGLPTGYFPQEDQVFHQLFIKRRMRLYFDPEIVVTHHHRTECSQFLQHQQRIGQANARVLKQIDLPGANLARRPWLALPAMPALILLRFVRTLLACRRVEDGLILRRPGLAWLCWRGMYRWGQGFLQGAFHSSPASAVRLPTDYIISPSNETYAE